MKLTKDEIVTMEILKRQGETNQQIAQRLGISEGTERFHLKRQENRSVQVGNGHNRCSQDGRLKQSLIQRLGLSKVVDHWWQDQEAELPENRS